MLSTFIAMLLAGAPSGLAVDVGRVNLSTLPRLERAKRGLPTSDMVDRVGKMLADGPCILDDQHPSSFNIDVPYAVLVEPDGSARRVIVQDIGCADLESYVGLIVLELGRLGDFRPTGEKKAKWYGAKLNFNLQ
jgi:hypothetical protein